MLNKICQKLFLGSILFGVFFLIPSVSLSESPQQKEKTTTPQKPHWKVGKKKTLKPQYENCQDADISSVKTHKESKTIKTVAEFCFTCFFTKNYGFEEVKEASDTMKSKSFREKLQQRVIGQIESRLYRAEILGACVRNDRNRLSRTKIDWPLIKEVCKRETKKLKSQVKTLWPEMRINRALSQVNADQIVTGRPNLSFAPSHTVLSFNSMPRLTPKEKKEVKKRWAESLSEAPLDKVTVTDVKNRFLEGQPLKSLTPKDQYQLKRTTWDMQKKAKASYEEIMSEMEFPILGYLNTGNPKRKDLGEAFLKVEDGLKDLLEKAKDPEVDMGLLLSFKPLVEGLLKDNKGYCLAAEEARIQAENDKSLGNWGMLGAGVTAAAPCFLGGPVAGGFCLLAGMAVGYAGYKLAQGERKDALGRMLTGQEFETLAGLEGKEKEEFLTKVLFPLGAFGTTAVPARAASNAIAKAMKGAGNKTITGKGHSKVTYSKENLSERKQLGEKSLGRPLSERETEALEKAHLVGLGEKGKDGKPAQIGNYTEAQLREKTKLLKEAGFSKEERRKLMQDNVVGWWNFWKKPPPPSTHILTELNQESTQIESSIDIYSKNGMTDYASGQSAESLERLYGNRLDISEIKALEAGDSPVSSIYWSKYEPRIVKPGEDPSLQYRGRFTIGFGKQFVSPEERNMASRPGYWYHHIHWDSGARDMPQLDQETIKQIFKEIYEGEPEKIVTTFQRQYVKEERDSSSSRTTKAEKEYLFPLVDRNRIEQIKQIVLRILKERGYQVDSGIQN